MNTLPAITIADFQWSLPLADETLLRLAEGELTEGDTQRSTILQTALRGDPALMLWSICYAWQEQRMVASIDDAEVWLCEIGLDAIARSATMKQDATNPADWVACCEQSLSRRLQTDDDGGDVLRAMLSNACAWFTVISKPSLDLLNKLAPPWLTEFAADDRNAANASVPKDIVKRAELLVANLYRSYAGAGSIFQKAHAMRRRVAEFEQQWDEQFLRAKLASLKEFTYGASHELNNPLFNISSRAQVLLRDEEDPERRRKLSTIYAHAMRASEMINDIALAARIPKPTTDNVEVIAVVREVVAELNSAAAEQAAEFRIDCEAESLCIQADRLQLAVAVREVCLNALEALKRSTRRGEVSVSVAAGKPSEVEITIADNGPGMDARARRHLFDPFFSGYESGRGLGFGLTKCWQIVDAHGGCITVDSQAGHGTAVTIRLPREQKNETLEQTTS